jgi:hypothetical protein
MLEMNPSAKFPILAIRRLKVANVDTGRPSNLTGMEKRTCNGCEINGMGIIFRGGRFGSIYAP